MSSSSALITAVFLALADVNRLARPRRIPRARSTARPTSPGYLGSVENGQPFGALAGDHGVGTFGGSEDHTAILCSEPGHVGHFEFCPGRRIASLPVPQGYTFAIASSGIVAQKTGNARERYNRASLLVGEILRTVAGGHRRAPRHAARRRASAVPTRAHGSSRSSATADRMRSRRPISRDGSRTSCSRTRRSCPRRPRALAAGDVDAFGRVADESQRGAEDLLENQVPETIALSPAGARARRRRVLGVRRRLRRQRLGPGARERRRRIPRPLARPLSGGRPAACPRPLELLPHRPRSRPPPRCDVIRAAMRKRRATSAPSAHTPGHGLYERADDARAADVHSSSGSKLIRHSGDIDVHAGAGLRARRPHCRLPLAPMRPRRIKIMLLDGESGGPWHKWQLTTPVLKKQLEDTGLFQVDVVTAPPAGGDFSRVQAGLQRLPRGGVELRRARRALARGAEGRLRAVRDERRRRRDRPRGRQRVPRLARLQRDDRHRRLARPQREGRPALVHEETASSRPIPSPGPAGSHGRRVPFLVTTQNATHPITRGLPKTWMHQGDELYASLRGPGTNMTVLATGHSRPDNAGHGSRRAAADGAHVRQGAHLPHDARARRRTRSAASGSRPRSSAARSGRQPAAVTQKLPATSRRPTPSPTAPTSRRWIPISTRVSTAWTRHRRGGSRGQPVRRHVDDHRRRGRQPGEQHVHVHRGRCRQGGRHVHGARRRNQGNAARSKGQTLTFQIGVTHQGTDYVLVFTATDAVAAPP